MSYDVYLEDPATGETIEFDEPHAERGGTYVYGGTREAWLNVTYNYSTLLAPMGGIAYLDGKTAAETLPALDALAASLGDDVDPDYWVATEGNAKAAVLSLQMFARARPDGVWRID